MKKNLAKIKAIEIINTFSNDEKTEFKKFLASPYFNSNRRLVKLYSFILRYEKKISLNEITEKELYLKVSGTTKYSYSSMRNLMSSLYQMCEEFLIVNSARHEDEYKFEDNLKLLKQYSNRFLDKNFQLLFEKVDSSQDYSYLGSKYFEHKFKLNYVYSNYEWKRNNTVKRRDSLYNATLNNICRIISIISEDITVHDYMKKTYSFQPDLDPARSLISNIDLNKFLNELKPMDDLRYNHIINEIRFIKLIISPDDFENYYILKKIIFNNIDKYSNTEKYYHISRLFNFLISKSQIDNSKIVSEISEFRKFQIKNIKYGSEGVENMPMRIFIDMIDSFLITEDIKFVESFIKENLDKVEIQDRGNALNYAMARLELKRNNYEKAIDHLNKLKLTENFLKLYSKMMIIQAFYEMENFESGLYALDSLKHFMKNNKDINPIQKTRFNFLFKIIDKIYKIRIKPESFSMFDLEKLSLEISRLYSNNETWYMKKIEELRKLYAKKGKLHLTGS